MQQHNVSLFDIKALVAFHVSQRQQNLSTGGLCDAPAAAAAAAQCMSMNVKALIALHVSQRQHHLRTSGLGNAPAAAAAHHQVHKGSARPAH
jgi:hypothetical protein